MTYYTAAEVAGRLRCSPRKIRETALRVGVGVNIGGRAGYRFSEADIEAITEELRPVAMVERRRRRRAS